MRILHIGKFYPPDVGGMEYFLRDLCRAQVRLGHEVAALCHGRITDQGQAEAAPGEPLLVRQAAWARRSPAPFAPGLPGRAARLQAAFRPHIAHVHLPNLSALAALSRLSCPVVVHWHADVPPKALPFWLRPAYPAYALLLGRALKGARRIVCTSEAVRAASPALAPFADACRVVPLGVDPGRVRAHPPLPVPRAAPRPFTVLSLGRFTAYKGFDRLVRAAALLPDARFILAGDGPLLAEMRRLSHSLGLAERVRFPGRPTDAQAIALLRDADVFCLPSVNRAEAFGLVILEAMAQAKPVVACLPEGSGVGEALQHGQTALAVPPDDPQALAGALLRLAADPALARRMGLAGLKRFEERFLIEHVARAIDAVYAQCGA